MGGQRSLAHQTTGCPGTDTLQHIISAVKSPPGPSRAEQLAQTLLLARPGGCLLGTCHMPPHLCLYSGSEPDPRGSRGCAGCGGSSLLSKTLICACGSRSPAWAACRSGGGDPRCLRGRGCHEASSHHQS